MTQPRTPLQPDTAGYLPNGRPTAERLLADAEERLELAERLPATVAAVRGWAVNDPGTLTVTVNSLGELVDLDIAEVVLRADPRAIGTEIVRLAGEAYRAASEQAITELAPVVGDATALDMARAAGLDEHIDPDAPVLRDEPETPGAALQAADEPAPGTPRTPDWQESDDEDLSQLDFSQFRSDR